MLIHEQALAVKGYSTLFMYRSAKSKLGSVLWIRIRGFFGLLDPDPLVRGTDLDPDPSIIKQKIVGKTLIPTVL